MRGMGESLGFSVVLSLKKNVINIARKRYLSFTTLTYRTPAWEIKKNLVKGEHVKLNKTIPVPRTNL